MTGYTLVFVCNSLMELGIARSKHDFSRRLLGRGVTYLRDFEHRDRHGVRVPPRTLATLCERLNALAGLLPTGAAREVREVLTRIEQDCRITQELGYGRKGR